MNEESEPDGDRAGANSLWAAVSSDRDASTVRSPRSPNDRAQL